MRSHRSGRLGEEFCREHFGIKEDDRFEIKSSAAEHGSFVVQAWQLLEQLGKQYVVVTYDRATRRVTRGPNKGKKRFIETIEQAYGKKLNVYVVPGHRIMEYILQNELKVYCTARGGNVLHYGKWGVVWRVPYAVLPTEVYEETEAYVLHADPMHPPGWEGDAVARTIHGGLFDAPQGGNGKARPPKEQDEDEDVPF